jgi:hypothetical protein
MASLKRKLYVQVPRLNPETENVIPNLPLDIDENTIFLLRI